MHACVSDCVNCCVYLHCLCSLLPVCLHNGVRCLRHALLPTLCVQTLSSHSCIQALSHATCLSALGKLHCPHPPCCHLQKVADTLDGMIDTVSAKHPLASYLGTLKVGGVVVMLGVPDEPMDLPQGNIIMRKLPCSPLLSLASASLIRAPSDCWVHGSLHLLWHVFCAPFCLNKT